VRAAIDQKVIEELEAAIVTRDESRRVADVAVQSAERDLRIADIARVAGHSQQASLSGKIQALVLAGLSAGNA